MEELRRQDIVSLAVCCALFLMLMSVSLPNAAIHHRDAHRSMDAGGSHDWTADAAEVARLRDHFTLSPDGYNSSLWTLETYGTGSVGWDGVSVTGLTASGYGHRTLVSKESFGLGNTSVARIKVTSASANPCWGWTDMTTGDYNYHFLDCSDGIWIEYNYPGWGNVTFYTKESGVVSQHPISMDATQFHDYEFRWNMTAAELYLDGLLKATETVSVPTVSLKYKMTVTAWWGNPTGQWLYVDSVNITSQSSPTTTTTGTTTTTTSTTTTTGMTTTTTSVKGIIDYIIENPYVLGAIIISTGTILGAIIRRERGKS